MRIHTVASGSVEGSARLIKAFSDPVRLRLVNLLAGGEVCVCHLHEALGLPQPTVSRHLAYLRKTGIVVGRKDGLWVHYRLTEASNDLHRALLDALTQTLPELGTTTADRRRLSRLTGC